MKRIAVIGGGISGLSAAFSLQKHCEQSVPLQYVLFESGPDFGGVVRTEHLEGCVLEAGPDSFLTEKPWAANLCRDLGLEGQLIGSNDSERKTYILLHGRLVPIPEGLMFMVPTRLLSAFLSPLFSWPTKLRILREWFYRPAPAAPETTVAEFVERHYGREMVERLADPLLAGVYGGSAADLSINAVLPRFVEMQASHGSLGKAMLTSRKRNPAPHATPAPIFTSLRKGMQQMVDALLVRIPENTRRSNVRVDSVRPENGKWLVVSAGRTEEFDAAVIATPAYAAAELLNSTIALAAELNAIRYSSSVTVVLAYDEDVRAALPPGFGFLVPQTEGRRILAATFVHNKFPHRAPPDRALIRCFLGGTRDQLAQTTSDDEILSVVRTELQQTLGITAAPLFAKVNKWPKSMAQYGLGHAARVTRIREHLAAMPGLALAGNAYSGIGVPDCIRSGSEAAEKVLIDLGSG